ncbi:hypothetical protein NP233_g10946 [Leucocoprinus birnbaumii]|uniref:Uncharacterized protein n=1 Tax=Leucocoprinus birnbaumii TaxID=56174 RepID=A0AAD5YLQ5_9AGAR|nr:hypothetical protein NP233_g10946 [Leucocoprinus birnbaumii]
MSICRTLLRAGSRSLPRPSSARAVPTTLHSQFSRQLFNFNTTFTSDTWPAASTSTTIEQHVEGLTETNDIRKIHTHYAGLIDKLKASEERSSFATRKILTEAQINKIFYLLAKSGRPSDIQKIHDIFLDMPLVLGVNPTLDTYTAIIRGFIFRGEPNATRRWLEDMPKRPGNFTPTLEQYHMFLEAIPDMPGTSLKFMRSVVNKMRQCGCPPTTETFKILFQARMKLGDLTESVLPAVSAASVFEDMEREQLPYDPSFSKLLLKEYEKRGFNKTGEQVHIMYEDKFRLDLKDGRKMLSPDEAKLVHMAQTRGAQAAVHLFKHLRPRQKPTANDISAMLRHRLQLRDLQLVEREFGIKCSIVHWSYLINNNVRAGKASTAYSIMKAAIEAGIKPDAPMVTPLIRHLCQPRPNIEEEDQCIGAALYFYKELCSAYPPPETVPLEPNEPSSKGPDYVLYSILLHGLSTAKQPLKWWNVAKGLMADMARRNLVPDDSNMVTSIVILCMRNSPTVEEALHVYRQHKSVLDQKGFTAVLATFCKLRFGEGVQVPSLKGYFEIVKDMRLAGFSITIEVYTTLLNQLGQIATQVAKEGGPDVAPTIENLIRTTRRVHDLLTLDSSLTADTILWNQLMDTYQRLGCFAETYRLWEMMYLSGQYDTTSVSIMLDACGFAGAHSVARSMLTKLAKDSYQFTLHNFNTWLESLCRMRRLDEAIGALCGRDQATFRALKPDLESVQIVFKFAKEEKRGSEVLIHVRAKLPLIWEQLPSSIRESINA